MQIFAGLDIGSTATKCLVMDGDGNTLATALEPTGWAPRDAAALALKNAMGQVGLAQDSLAGLTATGYGRKALAHPRLTRVATEIACHALGVSRLAPDARLVLDIGGQDAKVILLGQAGQVLDFAMNDKCAAGTGRFVSHMAASLGMDIAALAASARLGVPVQLSSMCAVFAESEVVGSIARGVTTNNLAAGIFLSIAKRLKALLGRFPVGESLAFTGGLAGNEDIAALLSQHLNTRLEPAPMAQFAGAAGAALMAKNLN